MIGATTHPTTQSIFGASIAYAGLLPGRFHPLRTNEKSPKLKAWQGEATRDPETLSRLAKLHSSANLGFTPDDGIFVLDVDCKKEALGFESLAALEAKFGRLPETLKAKTPSGGVHLYYRVPLGTKCISHAKAANRYKGLDIRASGDTGSAGYVVIPPSRTDDGLYTWENWDVSQPPHIADAPAWLVELSCRRDPCAPAVADKAKAKAKVKRNVEYSGDDTPLVEHLRAAMAYLDFSAYDEWVAVGHALKTLPDDDGLELWLEWSSGYKDFDEADAVKRWKGFEPGSTSYKAVFAKAQAAGWHNPGGSNDASVDAVSEAVAEFNKTHAVVLAGGSSVVMRNTPDERGNPSYEFLTRSAASMFYENRTVPVPKTLADGQVVFKPAPLLNVWLKHPDRKTFGGITFAPGGDAPDGFFNTWQGLAVEPLPVGMGHAARKCRKLLHHIRHNMCHGNRYHYRYFLAWVADMFQNPGIKQGVACVVRGLKGVGKSKVAEALQTIIGNHAFKASKSHQIVGHFNQQLLNKLLIIAEESFFAGSKADNGTLKDMITSPTITIEPKGINAFEARSCHRIYMITNNEWAVPASEDERRFFVLDVGEDHKQDFAYFAAIDDELYKGDGLRAFLTLLQKMDISGINLRKVPQTKALEKQKILSLEPHDQFILDCLENGEIAGQCWLDEIGEGPRRQEVYDCYVAYARSMQVRPIASNRFGKAFESRTGAIVWQPGGSDRRRKFELPPLHKALARFNEQIGIRHDHDD